MERSFAEMMVDIGGATKEGGLVLLEDERFHLYSLTPHDWASRYPMEARQELHDIVGNWIEDSS